SPREARDPALQALRPGCEELAVTDPAQMPVRQARPRSPKPPRWSAERRASRVMGRKAPRKRLACRVISAFTRVFDARWHAPRVPLHPNVSRRSAHPSIRVGEAKIANPGRRHAPRERDGLFEIVRWITRDTRVCCVSRMRCSASVSEWCIADPGPPRTRSVTVPGLQRTTSCCAAPGTRERRDALLRRVENQPPAATNAYGLRSIVSDCY